MSQLLSLITAGFIPAMAAVIIAYGLIKKDPVYDYFIEGAKKGLVTSFEILPFLIGIFLAVSCLSASGLLAMIHVVFQPFFSLLGVPADLLPLIFLRAVSGSGSLLIVQNIMETSGPDSYAGRAACVMAGGCETIIYVLALYFGVTHAKNMRHTLKAGLIGYITGVIVSLLVCRIL